jgi:hypothetical protein
VASQEITEFLLLPNIHLHVTQGKDLIVGQGFHRRFSHGATDPLQQHALRATMRAYSDLSGSACHLLGKLKRHNFSHFLCLLVVFTLSGFGSLRYFHLKQLSDVLAHLLGDQLSVGDDEVGQLVLISYSWKCGHRPLGISLRVILELR